MAYVDDTFTSRSVVSAEMGILRPTPKYQKYSHLLTAVLRTSWVRVQSTFLTRSSSLSRRRLQEDDLHSFYIPWNAQDADEVEYKLAMAMSAKTDISRLISAAIDDVEAVVDGNVDKCRLLAEGEEIEGWLKQNPSPYAKRSGDDARE